LLPAAIVLVLAAAAAYLLLIRQDSAAGRLVAAVPASVIGAGPDAVAVGPRGEILAWLPPPEDGTLPELPLEAVPDKGVLGGEVLDQARVLGAAPPRLRAYVAGSHYGDSGVDVTLRSGIELRFGDPSRAAEKWRSAATVLASPTITTLDYVDLLVPGRPSIGGSGHTLPPPP
jgi:hypothetical protein